MPNLLSPYPGARRSTRAFGAPLLVFRGLCDTDLDAVSIYVTQPHRTNGERPSGRAAKRTP